MNSRKLVLIEKNGNFGLQMDNANYVLQQMEASLQVKEVQTKFLFVVFNTLIIHWNRLNWRKNLQHT